MRSGCSYWRINTALLREESFQEHLRQRWVDWPKQTKNYPNALMWWERVAKVHIKKLFFREGIVKRQEEIKMENLYFAYLYDTLQRPILHVERTFCYTIWMNAYRDFT